jgi:protein-tyrosine phosphatase
MTISQLQVDGSFAERGSGSSLGAPIPVEGTFNLRDLGGYSTADGRRTRRGRIFRADSLAKITDAGLLQLEALALGLVCDLRSDAELEHLPDRVPDAVRHHHNPMQMNVNVMGDFLDPTFDGESFRLESMYIHMLDYSGETFRRVFEQLADADSYPYLFHCAGGKDRTGMVAALVLRIVGVPDEVVVEDFNDTYILPKIAEFREAMRRRGMNALVAEKMFRAPAEAMVTTLAYLDERYGSAAGYLASIGVTDQQIAALVDAFVE